MGINDTLLKAGAIATVAAAAVSCGNRKVGGEHVAYNDQDRNVAGRLARVNSARLMTGDYNLVLQDYSDPSHPEIEIDYYPKTEAEEEQIKALLEKVKNGENVYISGRYPDHRVAGNKKGELNEYRQSDEITVLSSAEEAERLAKQYHADAEKERETDKARKKAKKGDKKTVNYVDMLEAQGKQKDSIIEAKDQQLEQKRDSIQMYQKMLEEERKQDSVDKSAPGFNSF